MLDNDCDSLVDDADPGVSGQMSWYQDIDGDLFGTGLTLACFQPSGHVPAAGDCIDTDGTVYPGALELCDGVDNNCD